MSKTRKSRNDAAQDQRGAPGTRTAPAQAMSWPATSSITMQPGSSDPRARATGPETATPIKPTASPDIKSPTGEPTIDPWDARNQAAARPSERAGGAGGDRREPRAEAGGDEGREGPLGERAAGLRH